MNEIIKTFKILIISLLISACYECNSGRQLTDSDGSNGLYVQSVNARVVPIFVNRSDNNILDVTISYNEQGKEKRLKKIILYFSANSNTIDLSKISVYCGSASPDNVVLFGEANDPAGKMIVEGDYHFKGGANLIRINISLKPEADLLHKLVLDDFKMILEDDSVLPKPMIPYPEFRFATVLRAAGQDNCNTYRIPGIITTNNGTLIAVYDNRYNSSKDLQEDIDIGMSRSIDGGQTWEPMRVIIDMGEYGGRSEQLNGAGDPCVLYDHFSGTIWVAALWMSGSSPDKMVWWASQPGMTPEVTGQIVVVKSIDDGLTWSEPYSITNQVKDPAWQLLFQGPGRGITTDKGILVFPAQYKADIGTKAIDGGQFTCHSTIIYSTDSGKTWHIGAGAKSNTTESQVVELPDGSLMLNMRDDRNRADKSATNGRAVAVTHDMGKSWETHPSSNSALPEPNCMASLIATDVKVGDIQKRVLFFSNPNNKSERKDMTIKASLDLGLTWPAEYQINLCQNTGFGYSCLTMVDKNILGILYEGARELYFQKIPVEDILNTK